MPYILSNSRKKFESSIYTLLEDLGPEYNEGEINYVISKLVTEIFKKKKNYSTANKIIGALECLKLEIYRRHIAEYENLKIKENGDI